ncbi:MAG: prolyl oligopeptidase family serine peptidase [Bacteroidota bacterium]
MKANFSILFIFISLVSFAQKKTLDHPDFDIWNTIEDKSISPNGSFIMYSLEKGEKDNHLKVKDSSADIVFGYERSSKGQFTFDSEFALFTIKAWQDSVKEMKRKKVKKKDMPKDTLGVYSLKNKSLTKIANVKSYKIPEKWAGFVAYQLEEVKAEKKKEAKADKKVEESEETKPEKKDKKKKERKVGKDNGYHLVVRNLHTAKQDTFKYVTSYLFAREGKRMAFSTSGKDTTEIAGVYVLNLETMALTEVMTSKKAKFPQLMLSESGKHLGFVADKDTTKAQVRPNEVYTWSEGMEDAKLVANKTSAPEGYMVSADGRIRFSKDDSKMYFGFATPPVVKDTTLIDEEIVNVEVWTYNEPRLYTVQEMQADRDKKKTYTAVYHISNNKVVQLATTNYPDITLDRDGNASYAIVSNPEPYQLESQWLGDQHEDYAVVNLNTGETTRTLTKIRGRINLSPGGKYVYGYDMVDSAWFTYSIKNNKLVTLTKGKVFYNELHDSPTPPYPYGSPGWTEDDKSLLIYDRYDIWQYDPVNGDGNRLTKGRESKVTYRYVKLDDEERFIDGSGKWLLTAFNENDKSRGYYEYNSKNKKGNQLLSGPYLFSQPIKAKENNKLIFTRESFQEFPDIRYSDLSFKKQTRISKANPQQNEYNWGTIELVKWTSLDGKELEGMLVKPENFDPNKKYPMIVNFYEKSSNGLHRHWTPSPGRSTINYSFYTSRGYIIFNPDVHYRLGYPGESAYNCVIPGVTSLIEKGFVDKDNIGVQGHSWGGYQIAYLVTKTDIFKAAEAGAPVPNMISAYGGIRWWSGLSRQFQYEHTQSRIGGTPWEYPARYIENSPIFNIDKINTPLLVMHNDADGHVPWYQGIEFFVSLRRLGKPSWFLNYNGEPHWPLKLQNRKDFNIRLAQFFDYYLKGAPMPVWMDRGVPAIEKGINQGLELIEK